MAWFRVRLTEEQQRIVNEERVSHPHMRVREKMLVLWLLHCGSTREQAAEVVRVSRATVQRYVAAFRAGGLDGLRQLNPHRPVSEMAAYRDLIRESFEEQPARTMAEACERIFQLTGLRRGPSQVKLRLTRPWLSQLPEEMVKLGHHGRWLGLPFLLDSPPRHGLGMGPAPRRAAFS
jgi:transposase